MIGFLMHFSLSHLIHREYSNGEPESIEIINDKYESLLMPGMDNTRHFYSITAVAGTV